MYSSARELTVILTSSADLKIEGILNFSELGFRVFNSDSKFEIFFNDVETINPLPNRHYDQIPRTWHTMSFYTTTSVLYELSTRSFPDIKIICGLITGGCMKDARNPLISKGKPALLNGNFVSFPKYNFSNFFSSGLCRISNANADYSVCATYPSELIVPASITDELLLDLAKFRRGGRFPLVTFFYRSKTTLLATSAELLSTSRNGALTEAKQFNSTYLNAVTSVSNLALAGMKFSLSSGQGQTISLRCRSDEKLLLSLMSASQRGTVVDIRSSAKYKKNTLTPDIDQYNPQWKRIENYIPDPSEIKDVFQNFIHDYNITQKPSSIAHDLAAANEKPIKVSLKKSTEWLVIVGESLKAASHGALAMDRLDVVTQNQLMKEQRNILTKDEQRQSIPYVQGSCVLILGNEGRDRTLVVASLVEIILSPDVRTIEGFLSLIDRVWVSGGHPFSDRYSAPDSSTASPIFILFLDCVWQIWCQYSSSFEFTEDLLTLLVEHVRESQFSSLSGNCDREREKLQINSNSISLWSFIKSPSMLPFFTNPLYSPLSADNEIIDKCWPSITPQALNIWREVYQKKLLSQSFTLLSRLTLLKARHEYIELNNDVQKLQGILLKLQDEAVCAKLLPTNI